MMTTENQENDKELRRRAAQRTWETLHAEQGVSLRDVKVYLQCMRGKPTKDVARAHGISMRDAILTVLRVERIFREHGRRHFQAALRIESGRAS